MSKEVVQMKAYNKLNMKVNTLENKIRDVITLIHINHYNTVKQGLEKYRKC